jgi:DivIVA domain-containing protein
MRHWILLFLLAITVAVIAYLVVWVFTGNDNGVDPQEPDGRTVPLPGSRPLVESDIPALRFDTVVRGYRMAQVDTALRRAAYDIGYKQELIDVLEAEVIALRDGRTDDAEALRHAREGALGGVATSVTTAVGSHPVHAEEQAADPGDDEQAGDGAVVEPEPAPAPPPASAEAGDSAVRGDGADPGVGADRADGAGRSDGADRGDGADRADGAGRGDVAGQAPDGVDPVSEHAGRGR